MNGGSKMSHEKVVIDTNPSFKIDILTREIINPTNKNVIMQFDHNSERFSFEMPRYIEGHDMSECDKIEVHFINESANGKDKIKDKYTVKDLVIDPDDKWTIRFSWLLSGNTSIYEGKLVFSVRFTCYQENKVDYSWGTAVSSSILVAKGLNNNEEILVENSDAFEALRQELIAYTGAGKVTEEGGEIFNNYDENIATGKNSHAEGSKTEATGENSHAQNRKTKASGKHSHAQNYDTHAEGESSTAMGVQTKAWSKACVAEGNMTEAGRFNMGLMFVASHAEGNQTKAFGFYSHSEGQFSEANGTASHAEGTSTIAIGDFSHTEGSGTKAYKPACHAEGGSTIAGEIPKGEEVPIVYPETEVDPETFVPETGGSGSGTGGGTSSQERDWGCHSEGLNTRALAMAAHSEGEMTIADKYASHAEGIGTIAHTIAQHVQGVYNKIDNSQKYLHIVGNGKNDKKRSNAHTIDWDGNAWFRGKVYSSFGFDLDDSGWELAPRWGTQKQAYVVIGTKKHYADSGMFCDVVCKESDPLLDNGDDFVNAIREATTKAIGSGVHKEVIILPGVYKCSQMWNIDEPITIKGVGMPTIEMGGDAVILNDAITISSSNVSIEGVKLPNGLGAQQKEVEGLRINRCDIAGIVGDIKKSFITENVLGYIEVLSPETNVIANNIINGEPQL